MRHRSGAGEVRVFTQERIRAFGALGYGMALQRFRQTRCAPAPALWAVGATAGAREMGAAQRARWGCPVLCGTAREQGKSESARMSARAFGALGYGMALQRFRRTRCAPAPGTRQGDEAPCSERVDPSDFAMTRSSTEQLKHHSVAQRHQMQVRSCVQTLNPPAPTGRCRTAQDIPSEHAVLRPSHGRPQWRPELGI